MSHPQRRLRTVGWAGAAVAVGVFSTGCDGILGGRKLTGTCTDDDGIRGEFVAGATVLVGNLFGDGFDEDADVRPEPGDLAALAQAETDADGAFSLEGLPSERLDVFVVHPDYFELSSSVSLKSESRDLDCSLTPFVFDVKALSWSTADFVPLAAGSDLGFNADPGLTWLIVQLEVTSHARDERFLDAFSGGFTYITADELIFGDRLQLNAPEGALPDQIPPLGTVRGAIYFEVPSGQDPTSGVLVPELEDGPARISIPFPEQETAP